MERHSGIPVFDVATIRERYPNVPGYEDHVVLCNDSGQIEIFMRPPFRLKGFAFLICRKGVMTISVNQYEYRVSERMVIVTFPDDIIHIVRQSPDFSASFILTSDSFIRNIRLDMHQVIPLFIKTKRFPIVKLDEIDEGIFDHYFSLLSWAVGTGESSFKAKILDTLATSLLYAGGNLIREQIQEQLNTDSVKSRKELIFAEFTKQLLLHYRQERSVKFYADQLHITPKYLSALIKDISGRTAAEWIDSYVIIEAKNLLKFSNMNIQEIAYSLNFDTQSFFGKYFKQHTGYSPSQFKLLK
ncbi:MAG: helix-turn-helix domain-containing protein [Bacteroidales bacterium]|nr:helix-turn-helix domain-containing protein [Bacteroidales bacterium]